MMDSVIVMTVRTIVMGKRCGAVTCCIIHVVVFCNGTIYSTVSFVFTFTWSPMVSRYVVWLYMVWLYMVLVQFCCTGVPVVVWLWFLFRHVLCLSCVCGCCTNRHTHANRHTRMYATLLAAVHTNQIHSVLFMFFQLYVFPTARM